MLPAYLVLLQRIATPDEPADVESQLLQLRAWVELERENGRLYYSVQEQQVVEYAIAAASRSLDKLASTTGEIDYGDMRSLATCLLMILDLCCVVMEEVVTQPYANSTGLQYVAYLESVRKQVPPTGVFSSIAAASSSIAAVITNHLQSTSSNSVCTRPSHLVPAVHSRHHGSRDDIKAHTARTSNKRLRGKLQKKKQATSAAPDVSTLDDESIAMLLGYHVLRLWGNLQHFWMDHSSMVQPAAVSDTAQTQDLYHSSLTLFTETIVPISRLTMAAMRCISSCRSSCKDLDRLDFLTCTLNVCTSVNFTTVQLTVSHDKLEEQCTAEVQEILQSQDVIDLLLITLAISTWLLWKKQNQQTVVIPCGLLSNAAAPAHSRKSGQAAARQHRANKQKQQQQVLAVEDHHMELLELLGVAAFSSDAYEKAAISEERVKAWTRIAELSALTAARNIRRSFDIIISIPAVLQQQQQHAARMSKDPEVSFFHTLLRLLVQLFVLVPQQRCVAAAGSCILAVARAAKLSYCTGGMSSAAAAAAERSVLTPIMSQGVPVMCHVLQQDMDQRTKTLLEGAVAAFLGLCMIQDHLPVDEQQQLWALIVDDAPFKALAGCEVAVRIIGRSISRPPAVGRGMRFIVDAAAEQQQLQEAAGLGGEAPGGCAAHLVSLLCSCVKYCQPFIDMKALELAAAVAAAAQKYAQACSSSSSPEFAASWVYVAACALMYCGRALLRSPATGAAAVDADAWLEDQHTVMSAGLHRYHDAFQCRSELESKETPNGWQESGTAGTTAVPSIPEANHSLACLGARGLSTSWQCSDVSDMLQRLCDATSWCGKQLQQLEQQTSNTSNSSSRANTMSDICSRLQRRSQPLQEGLTAAVRQWKGEVGDQIRQQFAGTESDGSSWMMFVAARQVVGYKLADQLQQIAVDLCAVLPTTLCCNNPSCDNLSGVSELSCVGRRKCSRCQAAGYCSRECQTQHWSRHKAVCKVLCEGRS